MIAHIKDLCGKCKNMETTEVNKIKIDIVLRKIDKLKEKLSNKYHSPKGEQFRRVMTYNSYIVSSQALSNLYEEADRLTAILVDNSIN